MQDQPNLWFSSLDRVIDILSGGVLLFIFVVVMVRLLGKRSTAQMNNFDWIIAVATGSLLASGVLFQDVTFFDAALSMVVLGLCQFAVTKLFAEKPGIGDRIKATPRMLTHKGHYLDDAMRKERVTRGEIDARLRQEGYVDVAQVDWVIIETDGKLSVIGRSDLEVADAACLNDVAYDEEKIKNLEPVPLKEAC